MSPERVALYLQALSGLSERQIRYMFDKALKMCAYIPKVAELYAWSLEGAVIFQKQDAEAGTKQITARPDKPQDWPRLDSVWQEIERRADEVELLDLAYEEPFTDEEIEAAMKSGMLYPGKDRYVDWLRRRQARERAARGVKRQSARERYGKTFETIVATRQPGEEG